MKQKGKNMLVYYLITIITNVLLTTIFYKNINITLLSVLPLALIILMLFQGITFKKEKIENGFKTNYGSKLTTDEENELLNSVSTFLFASIPWMIPFIIFFPSFIKSFSVIIYLIGFLGGFIFYRIKSKNEISTRIESEEKERQEQEKKEQLGKWK